MVCAYGPLDIGSRCNRKDQLEQGAQKVGIIPNGGLSVLSDSDFEMTDGEELADRAKVDR
jgi:hypothetical protein